MPALSHSSLPYLFACCAQVGLLVISLAYVLSPREVNLNVSFEPPGGYIGEGGRYVDVTVVTLTNEDTLPIRGIECRYRYVNRESGRVVRSGSIETGDLEPGQAKFYTMSISMYDSTGVNSNAAEEILICATTLAPYAV